MTDLKNEKFKYFCEYLNLFPFTVSGDLQHDPGLVVDYSRYYKIDESGQTLVKVRLLDTIYQLLSIAQNLFTQHYPEYLEFKQKSVKSEKTLFTPEMETEIKEIEAISGQYIDYTLWFIYKNICISQGCGYDSYLIDWETKEHIEFMKIVIDVINASLNPEDSESQSPESSDPIPDLLPT